MSYIGMELDALNVCPDVGDACGLTSAQVCHGLMKMWANVFRTEQDVLTTVQLQGFMYGAKLAPDALVAFGFLEHQDGDRYRVKGSGRLLGVKKARRAGGLAAKKNLIPGPHFRKKCAGASAGGPAGDQPERQPETQWTKILGDAAGEAAGASAGGPAGDQPDSYPENRLRLPPALQPTTNYQLPNIPPPQTPPPQEASVVPDPETAAAELQGDEFGNFPPTGLGFVGWWQAMRKKRNLLTEPLNIPHVVAWHDQAAAEVGPEGVAQAARAYLRDEHFRPRGWPLRVLMSPNVWRSRAQGPPVPASHAVDPDQGIMLGM